ncbi:galactosylgalactosylxylosylprotein 3-beta-glucuronosyltransferase 1 [Gadus macrocephalus]|uniref:galactosylgalactosylxylosylprotein 3-beta-glucuronosyltransferase 1 n=1 Tax=Gadus macrocephalus TaxID=80720 RepID=UPI0028CBB0CD|nr:galactosylgalactosylxylosylprotein 3-beta-glucuronosyltransferase 1 [Gadus macrocephalus]
MVTNRDFVTLLLIALPWSLLIWHLSNGNHTDLYWKGTPDRRNGSRPASGDPSSPREGCAPRGRAAAGAGGGIVEAVRTEYVYSRPPPWSATLAPLYVITATFPRAVQKAELTRMANTFLHVANLHWVVIEDARNTSALVRRLLKATGLNYTHLHLETPRVLRMTGSYPRGGIQKNLGLRWLRLTMGETPPGVVYFADDDNVYSLQLFEEMRSTTMVSVWPVGFIAGRKYESPKINAQGKVCGWVTGFAPNRPFAIDMAGFAINLKLLIRKSEVVFKLRDVKSGYQETNLLSALVSLSDLEPKADNCTKVLVWHTRTERPTLVNEGQRGFSNPEVEV